MLELRFELLINAKGLMTKALALNLSMAWRAWVLAFVGESRVTEKPRLSEYASQVKSWARNNELESQRVHLLRRISEPLSS